MTDTPCPSQAHHLPRRAPIFLVGLNPLLQGYIELAISMGKARLCGEVMTDRTETRMSFKMKNRLINPTHTKAVANYLEDQTGTGIYFPPEHDFDSPSLLWESITRYSDKLRSVFSSICISLLSPGLQWHFYTPASVRVHCHRRGRREGRSTWRTLGDVVSANLEEKENLLLMSGRLGYYFPFPKLGKEEMCRGLYLDIYLAPGY